jgi:hypothetical protein
MTDQPELPGSEQSQNEPWPPLPPGKRRGRPPGSPNKRTELWHAFWDATHGSALSSLWPYLQGDLVENALKLAARLGCKPIEAVELLLKMIETAASYQHAKPGIERNAGGADGDVGRLHLLAVSNVGGTVQIAAPAGAAPDAARLSLVGEARIGDQDFPPSWLEPIDRE